MSIKATFPAGVTELTAHGLHQWDYGQSLEIAAGGLPALVEVHFACAGMKDAVVRSCAVVDGSLTAAIPDRCLEQTTPVVAWVYVIGDTEGHTALTVTLPITKRARPQTAPTLPEEVADKYAEAIAAMNEAVADAKEALDDATEAAKNGVLEALTDGSIVAKEATHAHAADEAEAAQNDANGNRITSYMRCTAESEQRYSDGSTEEETLLPGGVVVFRIEGAQSSRVVTELSNYASSYSPVFYDEVNTAEGTRVFSMRLAVTHVRMGQYHVRVQRFIGDTWADMTSDTYHVAIYYKYLTTYPVG